MSLFTINIHLHEVEMKGEVIQLLYQLLERSNKMATVQDVKDAIAKEAEQVKQRLDELASTVQALRDQVANGSAATPEQLDELKVAVEGIFTPS